MYVFLALRSEDRSLRQGLSPFATLGPRPQRQARKRVKQSLERTLCAPCPYCEGAGYVKSAQTVIGEILQEAQRMSKALEDEHTNIVLRVNPEVGKVLKSNAERRESVERIYSYFPKLRHLRTRVSGYLSGGEQQMLVIGRALMAKPSLVLLDEPSLGLAPLIVAEIFDLVEMLRQKEGIAFLVVEQNAKVALETADYGYVLEIGRVVMNDVCERLMHSKDIQEFYLGAKEAGARGERRWKKKKTWR